MSNGAQQCCALDLPCCKPPGNQIDAVILIMAHGILGDTFMPRKLKIEDIKEMEWFTIVRAGVEELLTSYGLVPRPVADAIRDGYSGFMKSRESEDVKTEREK